MLIQLSVNTLVAHVIRHLFASCSSRVKTLVSRSSRVNTLVSCSSRVDTLVGVL